MPAIESDVSSLTVCAPGTVFTGPSFTEVTVMETASESVAPLASVDSTVSVSRAVEVGVALVREAGQRRVDLGLRPRQGERRGAVRAGADVAPPARLTFSEPLVTVSWAVDRLPSTSLTEMPPIESDVSSLTVCAPGTVFTGPSLIELR